MTCAVCGAEFCWLCMKEISDLHYLRYSSIFDRILNEAISVYNILNLNARFLNVDFISMFYIFIFEL